MKLLVVRALWGMTGAIPEQMERIARAGYDGVEFWPDHTGISLSDWARFAEQYSLKAIVGALVPDKEMLEPTLNPLAEFQPLKINLHSGRDSMSRDEGCAFFEEALRVEAKIGVPVAHETHRGRVFYTPWDTAYYLREFETLKINADYSHWVNVCERLPDDQAEAMELANQRAIHIHGRVGYEEGPQVPHPAAPEYAAYLGWHERQWQRIRDFRQQAGDAELTFTPEYGPPNYLHTLPFTNAPVADLWDVCLWAMERARQQFR
jgi:sugar phosphate isomerase/epimerase